MERWGLAWVRSASRSSFALGVCSWAGKRRMLCGGLLLALQRAMFAHAADVLYEAPASRVGDHLLRLVATAVTTLCVPSHRNDALMRNSHGVSYDDPPPRPAPKLPKKKKKKKKRLAAAR